MLKKNSVFLIEPGIQTSRFINNRFINRGLLSIATFLKKNGYNVDYFAFNKFYITGYNFSEALRFCLKRIKNNKYNVIAISNLHIPEAKYAIEIVNNIKRNFPDIKIIIGGYFYTINDTLMKTYTDNIDYIVKNEGEWTTLKLLNYINDKSSINLEENTDLKLDNSRIGNTVTLHSNKMGDLSDLPALDYKILPNDYLNGARAPNINLEFNRGCYFNCRMCSVTEFWHHTIRFHNINKILSEIRQLIELGYKGKISIEDSTLDFKSDRMKLFLNYCKDYKNKSFSFDYITTRYDFVDEECLEMLHANGFKDILFGLETASESLMKIINKKINLDKFKKACRKVQKAKLNVNVFVIIGLPGETESTLKETYRYVESLIKEKLITNVFVSHFQPYENLDIMEDFYKWHGSRIVSNKRLSNWILRGKPLVTYPHLDQNTLQYYFKSYTNLNKLYGNNFFNRF